MTFVFRLSTWLRFQRPGGNWTPPATDWLSELWAASDSDTSTHSLPGSETDVLRQTWASFHFHLDCIRSVHTKLTPRQFVLWWRIFWPGRSPSCLCLYTIQGLCTAATAYLHIGPESPISKDLLGCVIIIELLIQQLPYLSSIASSLSPSVRPSWFPSFSRMSVCLSVFLIQSVCGCVSLSSTFSLRKEQRSRQSSTLPPSFHSC